MTEVEKIQSLYKALADADKKRNASMTALHSAESRLLSRFFSEMTKHFDFEKIFLIDSFNFEAYIVCGGKLFSLRLSYNKGRISAGLYLENAVEKSGRLEGYFDRAFSPEEAKKAGEWVADAIGKNFKVRKTWSKK